MKYILSVIAIIAIISLFNKIKSSIEEKRKIDTAKSLWAQKKYSEFLSLATCYRDMENSITRETFFRGSLEFPNDMSVTAMKQYTN